MRNLKRALSLALAFVMVLSVMIVGAGAVSIDDFSDKDQIVNTEAVMTMVSLGVINGKDDGSYDPTGIVTRAEMAKLIAVTLNGGKDPTLGAITANFTDTKGHWAESYIAYVASLGIIDGRGDGTFGPNDQVTGAQAAKMILTMLGYRSDIEGFTGANWAINVQTKGNDIDLFADMSINPDEGLTRDDTAQMLYNGIQSWMVEYRNLEGSYDGIVYPLPLNGTKANSTVLIEKFKVDKVEGVVTATSLVSMAGATTTVEGKTYLTDVHVNGEDGAPDGSYPVAIDSELLGQRVVLYVQGLNDLAPNAASTKVIGTPIVSLDNTVITTTGRLKDTAAVKDALKGSGIAVRDAGAAGVTITEDDTAKAATGYTGVQSMPGVTQTFIDNDADGYVDVIIAKNPALAKVNTYNESKETMNISGVGTVDFIDVLNPEDVAQGDYVLVYNYDDTYVLAQAETVSGVVSAYVNNKDNVNLSKITIDGTNYGKGSGKNLAPDVTTVNPAVLTDLVDGTYTLYLDPNGNMLGYVEDAAAIGSYAVITGVNPTGTANFRSVEVKLLMADGSTGKYDVNLLASTKKWGESALGLTSSSSDYQREEAMYAELRDNGLNKLVTFSLDGNTVTLGTPASTKNYGTASTASALELKNSKSSYLFGTDTLMADDNTAFFIKDTKGDYSVVKGLKNLPADALDTTGTVTAIYYQPTGSKTMTARAIFAEVTRAFTSNSSYAFITSDYTKTIVGAETIYTYTVVNENGETMELKSKSDDWVDKTWVQEYQLDGEYVIFGSNSRMINEQVVLDTGSNAVSVANADDGVTGKTSYPVPASAKVWNVEDSDNIFATTLQKYDKVALVLDEDGNVKTAYVYDRLDGDLAVAAEMPPAFKGTPLQDIDMDKDGNYVVYNVAATDALTLPVALKNNNQTVTVKAEMVDAKGATGTLGSAVSSSDGFKVTKDTAAADRTATIYTAKGDEDGTTIKVTVNVAEDGYATRTTTYNVILWSGAQTLAAPSVKLIETKSSSADIDSVTELALADDAATDVTVTYGDGANLLAFAVTPAAGTDVALSLTKDGAEIALGASNSFAVTGNGTYTLTAIVSKAGSPDITYNYVANVTGKAQSAAAPVYTITTDDIDPVTGEVTVVVPETQTDDQSTGLADGTSGNGMFTGFDPKDGVKYTWVETRIPYTAAQYTANNNDGGRAIWTYNPSYADCGYATSFPGNVNDSLKTSALSSEDGGYIRMYTLVSSTLVNSDDPTITFKIKFGADNKTFGQAEAAGTPFTPDLVITLDVSGITFN